MVYYVKYIIGHHNNKVPTNGDCIFCVTTGHCYRYIWIGTVSQYLFLATLSIRDGVVQFYEFQSLSLIPCGAMTATVALRQHDNPAWNTSIHSVAGIK